MYNLFAHPGILPTILNMLERSKFLSDIVFKIGMKVFFGGSNQDITYTPAEGVEAVFNDFQLSEIPQAVPAAQSPPDIAQQLSTATHISKNSIYRETVFSLQTFPYMNNISGRLHGTCPDKH